MSADEQTDKQIAREIDKAREDQERLEEREAKAAEKLNPGVLYNPLATLPNPTPNPLPDKDRPGPKTGEVEEASPPDKSFETRPNPTKDEPKPDQ